MIIYKFLSLSKTFGSKYGKKVTDTDLAKKTPTIKINKTTVATEDLDVILFNVI